MDKDMELYRLATFYTQQEICDMLNITVEELLDAFDDKLKEYLYGDG